MLPRASSSRSERVIASMFCAVVSVEPSSWSIKTASVRTNCRNSKQRAQPCHVIMFIEVIVDGKSTEAAWPCLLEYAQADTVTHDVDGSFLLTSNKMSTSSASVNCSVSHSSSWPCQLSQMLASSGSLRPCHTLHCGLCLWSHRLVSLWLCV